MVSATWNLFPAPANEPTFPTTTPYRCPPGNSNVIPKPCFFFYVPLQMNRSSAHPIANWSLYQTLHVLTVPYITSSQFQPTLCSKSLYPYKHQVCTPSHRAVVVVNGASIISRGCLENLVVSDCHIHWPLKSWSAPAPQKALLFVLLFT